MRRSDDFTIGVHFLDSPARRDFVPQADILCLDMGELVLAVVAQQKHAGWSSTDQGGGTRRGVKICGLLLSCGSTKNGPIVSERREMRV